MRDGCEATRKTRKNAARPELLQQDSLRYPPYRDLPADPNAPATPGENK